MVLLGPTGSGKTAAAVALARRLPIEVVSADSRQVRRGMEIGSAAPTAGELAAVPHHLVGVVEPDAPWSLADFLARAREALEAIRARGATPLLTGGTGQYVRALLEGWRVPAVPPDPALRARLGAMGEAAVFERLEALDPASAARIGGRNARRAIRAIEIAEATGRPVGPLRREPPPWPWRAVGLAWPREALYARTDARAARMYADGLVAETRALIARHGADFEALRSIGHAEAARVVAREWDEATALERTRRATRRLVRRQAAWFRPGDPRIDWRDGADPDGVAAALEAAARDVRAP